MMSYNTYIQLSNDTRSLVQEQSDVSMFGGGEGENISHSPVLLREGSEPLSPSRNAADSSSPNALLTKPNGYRVIL